VENRTRPQFIELESVLLEDALVPVLGAELAFVTVRTISGKPVQIGRR